MLTFLGCFNLDWKGDGICDDQNNHAGCNFDGGDCCGPDADTDLCTLCQCLEEEEAHLPYGKICRLLNYSTKDFTTKRSTFSEGVVYILSYFYSLTINLCIQFYNF